MLSIYLRFDNCDHEKYVCVNVNIFSTGGLRITMFSKLYKVKKT